MESGEREKKKNRKILFGQKDFVIAKDKETNEPERRENKYRDV